MAPLAVGYVCLDVPNSLPNMILSFITGFCIGIWTLFFTAVWDHRYSTALGIRICIFWLNVILLTLLWICYII